jgi:hypothetical protein
LRTFDFSETSIHMELASFKIIGTRSHGSATFIDVEGAHGARGTLRLKDASRELIAALVTATAVAIQDANAGAANEILQAEAQRRRDLDAMLADWQRRHAPQPTPIGESE